MIYIPLLDYGVYSFDEKMHAFDAEIEYIRH
jgi:hypothetical protein